MLLLSANWTNVAIQTCMGIGVVFCVLVILVLVLKLFGLVFAEKKSKIDIAQASSHPTADNVLTGIGKVADATEAEKAAIAMALHLYFNAAHDTESYTITIKHNHATAWNSKVFGINKLEK